jgi:tetratricopeptide (TPR) repeat protein
MEAAFSRALELCENVDAPEQMFRALFVKSLTLGMRGQQLRAIEVAKELVRRAEEASDEGALLVGLRRVSISLFLLGRVVEAMQNMQIMLSKFDRSRHGHLMVTYGQDPAVVVEAFSAVCHWVLGWPNKARAASERAIARALELDHVATVGAVLARAGLSAQAISRDISGLRQTCRLFQELTAHHKMPFFEMWERLTNAMVESMDNPSHQTATELRDALLHYQSLASNSMFFPQYWGGFLAENYCANGEPTKALDAIDRGFQFAEASDEHWSDSELYRMRGVALTLRDGIVGNNEAEAWLRRAVDDARSRSAKSLELRAATSLARYLRDQGRNDEARESLAPVYDWFTEGFDTPDLVDARTLRDELS